MNLSEAICLALLIIAILAVAVASGLVVFGGYIPTVGIGS